ncbi:MAG: hypothetical protein KGM43_02695, partial [Planctomycetota bacterium]|nr:hypothetical protein [Planctomycetota bacterium]
MAVCGRFDRIRPASGRPAAARRNATHARAAAEIAVLVRFDARSTRTLVRAAGVASTLKLGP